MDEPTRKTLRKSIGKHLQQLRKEAGFSSAKAFAETVGFNPNTYTQYEQGLSGFNYEQAWQLADALECSMDELGGREWPPGGAPALTADERGLVDSYRLMDGEQRGKYRDMAGTFVMASEKDGPGAVAHVGRAGVGAGHAVTV